MPPVDAELQSVIDAIPIIDTHEHLEDEADRLASPGDFSRFFQGVPGYDLLSAGMAPRDLTRFLSAETDLEEKWRLFAPFWQLTRQTGHGQAIRHSLSGLYDSPDLSAGSIVPITEAMRAGSLAGDEMRVLRERAGIALCLQHHLGGPGVIFRPRGDPQLFRQSLAIQHFLANRLPVPELERQTGLSIESLPDLLRVIDWFFAHYGDAAAAIATNSSQWRSLRFDDVTQGQAQSLFQRGYVDQEGLSSSEVKALQDFLFHYCIQRAIDYRLPIQIETGSLDSGGKLDVTRIRAIDLIPLFRKYPQARFVLLHIGYPYQHEMLAIARQFSNVYVGMGIAWSGDPEAAGRFARQWIGTTPVNKLFAFGGSATFAAAVYGHARMAREGLCRALSDLIADGSLGRSEAEALARRFLYDNAWMAFRLDDKRGRTPE
jgi:hypothetical protein